MSMQYEMHRLIKDSILKTLHENSGGMKELALVIEISKAYLKEFGLVLVGLFDDMLDELERENKIGVLVYTWHMSEDAKREKRFIYTP